MSLNERATTPTTETFNIQEVTVGEVVYINNIKGGGWVNVLIEEKGVFNEAGRKVISLCEYTKLMGIGVDDGRYFFEINEGQYSGVIASIVVKGGADTNIGKTPPIQGLATIEARFHSRDEHWYSDVRNEEIDQIFAEFVTGNGITGTASLISNHGMSVYDLDNGVHITYQPVMPGLYEIAIPDRPHNSASPYDSDGNAPFHQVWFPLVGQDGAYVHLGHYSSGCFTIINYEAYTEIYNYLIKHRSIGSDGYTPIVGTLRVLRQSE